MSALQEHLQNADGALTGVIGELETLNDLFALTRDPFLVRVIECIAADTKHAHIQVESAMAQMPTCMH